MIAAIFALFGFIIGSFLNVVILRHGSKQPWHEGRSACPHCGYSLEWYDMIPVFSYLFLVGKCRSCKKHISIQYPLVEAATAIFFALVGASSLSLVATILALAIGALLICIFVYDLREKLIPDVWVWPFIALALASVIFNFQFSIFDLLAGPVTALPILFLWYLSKPFTGEAGQWMGFGDVKFALGMGFLLGFPAGLIALLGSFVIGAVVSVCILLPLPHLLRFCGIRPHAGAPGYTMKSEVPFGPFLIASTFLFWFAAIYGIGLPFQL